MNINKIAEKWLQEPFDQETQNEVQKLQNDPKKFEDAFYKDLEFGTGGMRGTMGVGTNRINKYTIGKNTQGLSNYLKENFRNTPIKAVVAYDCRHNSAQLAKVVADVFTANGIECYLFSELRATPELSFAVRNLKAQCGIVLTASHNPPEYNGYKVYWDDGGQLVPPHDIGLTKAIDKIGFEDIQFNPKENLLHWIDEEIDSIYQDTVVNIAQWSKGNRDDFKLVFTPLHGTSITAIPQVLEKAGYKHVHIVEEQATPDGDFPTVTSPNPEEPQALAMAIEKAIALDADMVIGTDPDCDRLGIAVKVADGDIRLLNGNQTMIVMTEFLLRKWSENGRLNGKQFIASTIVSTPAMAKMAAAWNVHFEECLTGFKWIAKLIEDLPHLEFIGGGEESFGYLVGDEVRDKDAVSAALLACEIAVDAKAEGKTFMDLLLDCYRKYGFYEERLVSIKKEGKEGAALIAKTLDNHRKKPPKTISGIPVKTIEDLLTSTKTELSTGSTSTINLPKANVLIFWLEDGSKIALRPSGTEPKIKFYFSVNQVFDKEQSWEEQQKALGEKIDQLENQITVI